MPKRPKKRDLEAIRRERFYAEHGHNIPLGYPDDPDESIWIGRDGTLDADEWLNDHLGYLHALENILRPIIQAHPSDSGMSDEVRLEQALTLLVNWKPKMGRKIGKRERLRGFARLVHEASFEAKRPSLAELARRFLRAENPEGFDANPEQQKQVDQLIASYGEDEEALMKYVTSRTTPEQKRREFIEEKVLYYLELLGIPTKRG